MNTIYGRILFLFILTIFGSCTIYEKLFDNPVDFKANEERGIGAPSFVFYPKTQSVTGHLADLIFNPVSSGSDSIYYNLGECEMIDHLDQEIIVNGIRGAEVIIE